MIEILCDVESKMNNPLNNMFLTGSGAIGDKFRPYDGTSFGTAPNITPSNPYRDSNPFQFQKPQQPITSDPNPHQCEINVSLTCAIIPSNSTVGGFRYDMHGCLRDGTDNCNKY